MANPLTAGPSAAPAPRPDPADAPLPRLRDDLVLLPGPRTSEGGPSWTLHDPAANRFLRIGWLEFEILQRWPLGKARAIAEAIGRDTPLEVGPQDVLDVLAFAERSELLNPGSGAGTERLLKVIAARRMHPVKWLLKNYLFLRVPLVRPDPFLKATLPMVGRLFSRGFLVAMLLTALLGLYLIGRQWDGFTHSLLRLFSLEGAVLGGGALIVAKVVHELGHGYAARLCGCRVPAMGVAFLILAPVLWTDTTEAWRLTSRRQRMLIDAGGMLAEMTLAAVASVVWSFLPDSSLRTGVFLLATTSWLMTLAINLNPLMRFDGYFLLADALDIPNLQERAFAMGRWWMRELLFGFDDPPPEVQPSARRRFMIGYAFAIWVYRFFLFLGIALLVYHLVFKLLGLFLMAVEIGWFIVRPIASEFQVWAKRRRDLRWNLRSIVSMLVLLGAVAAFLVPWQGHVSAPGLLQAERQAILYALTPGRILSMPEGIGSEVAAGTPAFVLDSPDLNYRIAQAGRQIRLVQAQASAQAFDPEQSDQLPVTWQEMESAVADLEEMEAQRAQLTIRAPFAGRIAELPDHLAPGAWVAAREPLALMVAPETVIAEAYVSEADLNRLSLGAEARFIPEDGTPSLRLRLRTIDRLATRELRETELASPHGGAIAARVVSENKLVPEEAIYRVQLTPAEPVEQLHSRRGTVVIDGERLSGASRLWKIALGILIRESGW